MQQVFAQLALDVESGKEWWLTKGEERLLEEHNSQHRSISLMRERLLDIIDLEKVGEAGNTAIGTVDLLARLGVTHPTNRDTKELTAILRELLGPSKSYGGKQKWRVPFRSKPDVVEVELFSKGV